MRQITIDGVNVITLRETVDLVALDAIIDTEPEPQRSIAVALAYIASWHGPDFDGVPISASAIESFDPAHPLYPALLDAISALSAAQRAREEGGPVLAA